MKLNEIIKTIQSECDGLIAPTDDCILENAIKIHLAQRNDVKPASDIDPNKPTSKQLAILRSKDFAEHYGQDINHLLKELTKDEASTLIKEFFDNKNKKVQKQTEEPIGYDGEDYL